MSAQVGVVTASGSQKVTRLTKRQAEAVILLADDILTDEQIASKIGRSRKWLVEQKRKIEFRAAIDEAREEIRRAVLNQGIADKVWRMQRLGETWDQLDELQRERGLITTETRRFGETEVETEYFNEGLIRQKRGVLDDAAKEMGERKQVNVDQRTQTFNVIGLIGTLDESKA